MNPARITAEDFVAVIEIEKGSKKKYELDKETGLIILDRILYTSTHYPANYGLIPRTLSDDGDPLDVLVLCSEVLQPMSLVRCYPIGVFTMLDGGKLDEKIIAIPFSDPTYNSYHDISELPSHLFSEMRHFFQVYKNLEGKYLTLQDCLDENKEKWLKAIEDDGLTWTHVSDLKGWRSEVVKLFNIDAVPTIFVLDAENRIIAKNLRGEALRAFVSERLK